MQFAGLWPRNGAENQGRPLTFRVEIIAICFDGDSLSLSLSLSLSYETTRTFPTVRRS